MGRSPSMPSARRLRGTVDAVKHHPALLMWVAGNEQLGADIVLGMVKRDVAEAKLVKKYDHQHPVASIYGEAPPQDVIQRMDAIDVWGVNYYDELSFGDLFKRYAQRSTKPFFLGEYGADAYDARYSIVNEDWANDGAQVFITCTADCSQ
eukprot:g26051.t1